MKSIKSILLAILFSLFAEMSFSQVYARFEYPEGVPYAVITNQGTNTVFVSWRCVNYQLGQYRDGSINLQPGYETYIGPNTGWYWQPGEELLWQVSSGSQYNISFRGKPCTATVGCGCSGFEPLSNIGTDRFICKKCKHEKKYHH